MVVDEPLSALDESTSRELMARLKELHGRLKTTFIHICHRVEEALTLGDMLAVMRGGRIEQCGTPGNLLSRPKNLYVARFLQLPNLITGEIRKTSGGNLFQVNGVPLKRTELRAGPAKRRPRGRIPRFRYRQSEMPASTDRIGFEIAMREGLDGIARLVDIAPPKRELFRSQLSLFPLESAVLKSRVTTGYSRGPACHRRCLGGPTRRSLLAPVAPASARKCVHSPMSSGHG